MIISGLYWKILVEIKLSHTSSGKQANGLTGPFTSKPKIYKEDKLHYSPRCTNVIIYCRLTTNLADEI